MSTDHNKPIRSFIRGVWHGFRDTWGLFSDYLSIPIWLMVLPSVLTITLGIVLLINEDYIILMFPILFIIYIIVIAYAIHKNE